MTSREELVKQVEKAREAIVKPSIIPKTEGLNQTEKLMLRSLVTDRIENRFQYATKLSQEMNIEGLASCVDEIQRLQVIGGKLQ